MLSLICRIFKRDTNELIYTRKIVTDIENTFMGESESEVAQLGPTLCDPMDYSSPVSFLHGISQARILEWVAISYCRGSFQLGVLTCVFCASFVSCIGRLILYHRVTWEAITFEPYSVAPARPLSLNFLRLKAKLLLPNTS